MTRASTGETKLWTNAGRSEPKLWMPLPPTSTCSLGNRSLAVGSINSIPHIASTKGLPSAPTLASRRIVCERSQVLLGQSGPRNILPVHEACWHAVRTYRLYVYDSNDLLELEENLWWQSLVKVPCRGLGQGAGPQIWADVRTELITYAVRGTEWRSRP
jgi:hypothetical protein